MKKEPGGPFSAIDGEFFLRIINKKTFFNIAILVKADGNQPQNCYGTNQLTHRIQPNAPSICFSDLPIDGSAYLVLALLTVIFA